MASCVWQWNVKSNKVWWTDRSTAQKNRKIEKTEYRHGKKNYAPAWSLLNEKQKSCESLQIYTKSNINKRPMGHIAHLRKPVQINKHIWLYHNVDYEKKKKIYILW